MADNNEEEYDISKGLSHKAVSNDLFSVVIRVFALVGGTAMFVADKFMHMVEPTFDMYVYAGIAGFVIGKEEVLKMLGGKH